MGLVFFKPGSIYMPSISTSKKFNLILSMIPVWNFLWRVICRLMSSAPVLIVLGISLIVCTFCVPYTYSILFAERFNPSRLFDQYFIVTYNFLFLFMIPFLFGKCFGLKNLKNCGLRIPENKMQALGWTLLSLLILIPTIILLSHGKQFHDYYAHALSKPSFYQMLLTQFTVLQLFYISEEFFFRGFLLQNLHQKIGWHSLWIMDILFTWAHLTKPFTEIMFAIPAGIIFAFLSLKTKSIFPSIVVHYCVGFVVLMSILVS